MKKSYTVLFLLLFSFISGGCQESKQRPETGLWPPIEPYETGFLQVSDIHKLYYEVVGNPDGKPVFVLHGGPGGGCWPIMRQLFNPEKFKIILFDQRGSNRSRPYGEIKENSTWELVEDIEKLRKHLGIKTMMLQGGSWGSTLALAYAESYPKRVTDMLLRGIFTGTSSEINHFYHGGTVGIFPDAYQQLLDSLPNPDTRPLPNYLLHLLTSGNKSMQNKIADAWLRYEWFISDVHVDRQAVNAWIKENDVYAFSLIENYYMANGCFLEENQLWDNIDKIQHIPLTIINGRFDIPCLPETAFRLHHLMPGSELIIVEAAGHGGDAINHAVADAIRKHEPR